MNVLLCGIMCTLDENYICLFLYVFSEFYEAWDHFFGSYLFGRNSWIYKTNDVHEQIMSLIFKVQSERKSF